MKHTLVSERFSQSSITVVERQKEVTIYVDNNHYEESITLTLKELHSFIGTLLHVQAKLKTTNNG